MRQALVQAEDLRLDKERRLKYQGTAQVRLEVLYFRWDQPRELNRKHVDYVVECFRKDGCRRLPERNHISAVIEREHLDAAVQASRISYADLLSKQADGYAALGFPDGYQLHCLHGRHRIQAAREFLLPKDHWWTVDLYLADLKPDLKTCLIEEFANEEPPTDGELYRKIRSYHFQQQRSLEKKWKARLRGSRKKNLTGLLRNEDLTAAFDALLVIPGLWDGMRLTTIHKWVAMKCDEEIMRYLGNIKQVWSDLVGGDQQALGKIDQATVKALQLRAPRASTLDAKILRSQLRGGEIFSAFSDHERDGIWSRLQMVDGLIPSLFTFFHDVQYLQQWIDCIGWLMTKPPLRESIAHAMERRHKVVPQGEGQVVIQVAEDEFRTRPGSRADQVDLGYRQLIACAMRHCPDIPKKSEEEERGKRVMKPKAKADEAALRSLADLAARVGYVSDQITALQRYPMPSTRRDGPEHPKPFLVTSGTGVPIKERCGPPQDEAYEEDRDFLFINHLHEEREARGESITSFFVKRSIYLRFFGKPTTTCTSGSSISSQLGSASEELEEQERERNRLELERLGRERLEHERLEQDRLEQRREQERQRLEQERLEQERLEQDRLEQERLEQERLEQERIEQERQEQETQRLAQERLEQEKERLEQERIEHERLEQERLELRRIEERLEREDLQERLGQALQAQESLEQEKRDQRTQERQENEKQEEEMRRRETREQDRRDQEKSVEDSERIRKRYTQIDMETVVSSATRNQMDLSTIGQEHEQRGDQTEDQLGRALVVVNPGSAHHPQTQVQDPTTKRLEQESVEQERLEQERLEQERLEQERLEQERLEQERLEQERLEQERLEQESVEQERLLQERFAQRLREEEELEQEEQNAMRRRDNRQEQIRQRHERRDQVRQEDETLAESDGDVELPQQRPTTLAGREPAATKSKRQQVSTPLAQNSDVIRIIFKVRERGVWRTAHSLLVNPSDPSEIERIAVKYMRKTEQIRLYDTDLNILTPPMCFQAAIANGSNMLLLIPGREVNINEELEASVSQLLSQVTLQNEAGSERGRG